MDGSRIYELSQTVNMLAGRFDANQKQMDILSGEIKNGKSFVARQPALLTFLQQLQSIMQEKTTAQFGDLLTAFVDDVLNNGKRIVLDLGNSNGMPTVKIEAVNNGWRESIIDGSGSLANIVSTGLRLIALSRIQGRKFIVLDEAECWTSPEKIGEFYNVINEIARTLKVQVLIISHHNPKNFEHLGRVIRFTQESGAVISEVIKDNGEQNKDEDIKEIHLRNFMAHRDTVVPLHPFLTFVIGENDIGKSALVLALRYLSYGDSSDNCIRHGENSAMISVQFETQKRVVWTRILKTNEEQKQKVRFQLFDDGSDNPSHDAYEPHQTPDFVQKSLGIYLHNELDIQIGNQKDPMFLIGPQVKATDRAKILSVGKETVLLSGMMEALRDKTRITKSDIKIKEQWYDRLNRENENLSTIKKMTQEAHHLVAKQSKIVANQQKIMTGQVVFKNFLATHKKSCLLKIDKKIDAPVLIDVSYGKNVIINLSKVIIKTSVIKLNLSLNSPTISNMEMGQSLIFRLKKQKNKASLKRIGDCHAPILQDTKKQHEIYKLFINNKNLQLELANKKARLIEWKQHLAEETKTLLKEEGDLCPLCHQPANANHFLEEKNENF